MLYLSAGTEISYQHLINVESIGIAVAVFLVAGSVLLSILKNNPK